MEIFITFLIIATCFLMLAIGYVLAGKKITGTCGGYAAKLNGENGECSICGKKNPEDCEKN